MRLANSCTASRRPTIENDTNKRKVKPLTQITSTSVSGLSLKDILDRHLVPVQSPAGGPPHTGPRQPSWPGPMPGPPTGATFVPYFTGNGAFNNAPPQYRQPPAPPGPAGGPPGGYPRTPLFGLFPQGHAMFGFKESGPKFVPQVRQAKRPQALPVHSLSAGDRRVAGPEQHSCPMSLACMARARHGPLTFPGCFLFLLQRPPGPLPHRDRPIETWMCLARALSTSTLRVPVHPGV